MTKIKYESALNQESNLSALKMVKNLCEHRQDRKHSFKIAYSLFRRMKLDSWAYLDYAKDCLDVSNYFKNFRPRVIKDGRFRYADPFLKTWLKCCPNMWSNEFYY